MNKHLSKLFSVTLVLALMMSMLSVTQAAQAAPDLFDNPSTTVFINEIHYDNSGTDTGEAVEIAGPAGTDLTGWSLEKYNGNGGFSYGTIPLSGVIPDQQNGFGTLFFAVVGLQNGAPDGIALVDPSSVLVQFLSYEGSFGGTEGPASGMTSTDIGVSEDSGTLVGESLQLMGSGTTYGDFTWVSASANTFGAPNTGQTFGGGSGTPDVSINEIRIDQPSTDNDEYFELAGAPGTSLDGLTYLVIGDGTGGSGVIENVTDLGGQVIGGSGFFVAAESTFTFGIADLTTSLNFENSDNVTHLLVAGFSGASGDDLDNNDDGVLDVTPWSELLDLVALVEEENPPSSTEYHYGPPSVGPDGSFVPGHAYLCPSGWEIGGFTLGTDDTPGAANGCVVPTPEVSINEIRIDQPSTDNDEYFELAGAPGTSLDGLTYLVIGDGSGGSGVIENVTDLSGQVVGGSGFFVAAEGTFSLGVADLTTSLNFENSDNVTHLLVSGFSGSNGADLDTNDDGTLDVEPWSSVVASVSLIETVGSGDQVYSATTVGPDGSFVPAHIFNCVGGWLIGPFDPVGGEDTPGAANNCPPPVIVINEIMQNPSAVSDGAGEWFELYNPLGYDVDINGWTVADNDSDSFVIDGTLIIPAGGYAVLGNNADSGTNGGVTVDYQYSGMFLSNGADELVLFDGTLVEIDRVEYDGGPAFPDPNGASMQLKDVDLDNNVGANWCEASTPYGSGDFGTPGGANVCEVFIHEVQGTGDESPLLDSIVVIEGIVVGDFQDDVGENGDLNGFFVQEEDGDADADPATSEGIFVFDGSSSPAVNVAVGDLVRVEGAVSEFNGLTEITSFSGVSVISSDNPLPAVTVLTLPVSDINDFEAYEGMYVTFPQALVISEYFNYDRFGEIVLTDARHFQPTAVYEPGSSDAANLALANSLARITLDDGLTSENPNITRHPNGSPFDLTNRFRGGDTVTNVTGVINYSFGLYRVQPTTGATYTSVNPRTSSPDPVGGNVTVASFNVLNYFTTLDDGSCPYSGGCRGADDAGEFTRQRDKIIAAIAAMDADVVGLIEIENHPGDVPTADLVSGLNDLMGAGTYDYIATGALGSDSIRQAFIYKPANVTPVGTYAALDTPAFLDPNSTGSPKNRPALAQTFSDNSTGAVFTAVVNHLKSKGSGCGAGDDDPEQGSCNLTRTLASQILLDWLATDPTNSDDEDFLIIGDLNAYDKEDPIDVLVAGGYTDLAFEFQGEYAYSYVFSGQWGYLDYALANEALLNKVTGATEWHINADEADLIDYDTTFKSAGQDAIYAPDAYRASDHDPVIVGMELTTEAEIHELIGDVQKLLDDGELNGGQANALISKLTHALTKLAEGKPGVAANQLDAFINQVEDFVSEGILTADQGDALIKSAQLLVDALSD